MSLPKIAIERPVFITCVVSMILILGYLSYKNLGVDKFPDVNFPFVSVTTEYQGAGAEEIETQVSKPVEDELSTLQGVRHIYSTSQEGVSIVFVEFTLETKAADAEQRVRDKTSLVKSKLPKETEEPVIRRFDPSDQPICTLGFQADRSPTQTYDIADQEIKPRLAQIRNVGQVEIVGGVKREIRVELDRDKLNTTRIGAYSVVRNIMDNGQNIPVGKFEFRGEGKNLLFRSVGEYRDLDRIRKTVVNFFGSDVPITVEQLGQVIDTIEEPKTYGLLNGQDALFLQVYKQSGANTVEVVDNVTREIAKINREMNGLPGKPRLQMLTDNARLIRMNLDDVGESIVLGIALTVIVVMLFLGNVRSTLITITSLPVSLLGSFILMYVMGFTLNMLTLLALSLAVGLLIDDAIVVRENIWRHLEDGKPPKQAALEGTVEVALAVVATTLVVISVFFPIAFLTGIVGQFFRQFGMTVCFAMAVSLFEAMAMGPMLSAHWAGLRRPHGGAQPKPASRYNLLAAFGRFQDRLESVYERVIRWTLRFRKTVIAAAVVLFIVSLGLAKYIPSTFLPESDIGDFTVSLKAPPDTSLTAMRQYTLKIDEILRAHKEVEQVLAVAGDTTGDTNTALMMVHLCHYKKRSVSTSQFKDILRKELEPYRALLQPKVGNMDPAGNAESPFNLVLFGTSYDDLVPLSEELVKKFGTIKGLTDITTNYDGGKEEFQIRLDPDKLKQMGVSGADVGMELRTQVEGIIASKYRENGLEYDIRVRLLEDQRNLQKSYGEIFVPNQNKNMVRLSDVSSTSQTQGPAKINRRNRTKYISINGELAPGGALGNIAEDAKKILAKTRLPAGVRYEFVGSTEDLADLVTSILRAVGLAVLFTFMVLASLYESPILPFSIMMAIPLAVVGAFVALLITGQTLNIFSMIAMIMLIGLVTKNSILLVDFTLHLQRDRGMPRAEALVKAGVTRLRPILMTTIALIAGMAPLALALTEVGKFRQSMGVAVVGGLLSSLFLTLLVVPAIYGYVDDFRLFLKRIFGRINPQ